MISVKRIVLFEDRREPRKPVDMRYFKHRDRPTKGDCLDTQDSSVRSPLAKKIITGEDVMPDSRMLQNQRPIYRKNFNKFN